MPVTVQFKDEVKHNGRAFRQNERVSLSEPTAARLVAMSVAEVVRGAKVPAGFGAMVDVFRSAEAKNRPLPSATRAKADAEKRVVFRRFGVEHATQL